jgi:hypothetical protein
MQNAHRRAFCVGIDWTDSMIINHSSHTVKRGELQSAHPLAATLAARLNAGAHERCAACLSWIDRRQTGAVAVYMPHDLRPHVAYVICKRCARAINGTPAQQNELTRKVEFYLDGGAK